MTLLGVDVEFHEELSGFCRQVWDATKLRDPPPSSDILILDDQKRRMMHAAVGLPVLAGLGVRVPKNNILEPAWKLDHKLAF